MFFTVKKSIGIDGKVYIPCVCYKITERIKYTIQCLADKGKVELHKDYVFFQNGNPVVAEPVKEPIKEVAKEPIKEVVKEPVIAEEPVVIKVKKSNKRKTVEQITDEPMTDDTVGF